MPEGVGWEVAECVVCHAPLTERLLMLVVCHRLPDDSIGIMSPALARVCSLPCLTRWTLSGPDQP